MLEVEGAFKSSRLVMLVGRQEGPSRGCAQEHPFLLLKAPARELAKRAVAESKQKCVVFCVDLINTVLSSLYGQARLYYSHDKQLMNLH